MMQSKILHTLAKPTLGGPVCPIDTAIIIFSSRHNYNWEEKKKITLVSPFNKTIDPNTV